MLTRSFNISPVIDARPPLIGFGGVYHLIDRVSP